MYRSLRGLNAVKIHKDLVATLTGEAKSDGTVTCYLGRRSFSSSKIPQPSESPPPILNASDEAILLASSEEPFASVRRLARTVRPYPSTVYDHLRHKLGLTVRYLHCVSDLLSEADKHTRAQLSFELFEMLQRQKDRAWHDIVTVDEDWFYFTTDHDQIWLPEGTEAPKREQITVQSRKVTVTIV
jgi:hypothetical protein